jgi:hypothetical protein
MGGRAGGRGAAVGDQRALPAALPVPASASRRCWPRREARGSRPTSSG